MYSFVIFSIPSIITAGSGTRKLGFAQVVRDTMMKEKGKELFVAKSKLDEDNDGKNVKSKNKWVIALKHLKTKQVVWLVKK